MDTPGTLKTTEPHPAVHTAIEYINSLSFTKIMTYLEAFSSCAIEGNRLGEVCAETLDRLMKKEPVSDRYLLGLCWAIRNMEENYKNKTGDNL